MNINQQDNGELARNPYSRSNTSSNKTKKFGSSLNNRQIVPNNNIQNIKNNFQKQKNDKNTGKDQNKNVTTTHTKGKNTKSRKTEKIIRKEDTIVDLQNNDAKIETTPDTYKVINIGTHNVRGFNEINKQQEFFDWYAEEEIDIIGITETKVWGNTNDIMQNNNKTYKSWWTGYEECKKTGGVGIAMTHELAKHVSHVIKEFGRLIALDINFKGKKRTRIINVYLNCKEPEWKERQLIIEKTRQLIIDAKKWNINIILMGDLNADKEHYRKKYSTTKKSKYNILKEIENWNLVDSQAETNEKINATWRKNANTERRLDYIYISDQLSTDLIWTRPIDYDFNSDHKPLIMTIRTNHIMGNRSLAREKRNNITRRIFNYSVMNEETWNDFKQIQNQLIKSHNIEKCLISLEARDNKYLIKKDMNDTWFKIEKCLKQSMINTIPMKYIRKSAWSNRKKFRSETFKLRKEINKITRRINRNEWHSIKENDKNRLKQRLIIVKGDYKGNTPDITETIKNLDNKEKESSLTNLKRWKNIADIKCKYEENSHQRNAILDAIEERINNLKDNKKKMLNSILDRKKDKIIIDKLIVNELSGEITLDVDEIKSRTKDHFCNINNMNIKENSTELEEFWESEYKEIEEIESDIYDDTVKNISIEEWTETIRSLPLNKATGPSEISYEVYKHLSPTMENVIRRYLNIIITQEYVPKFWRKAYIYPIPKPGGWKHNLNRTRPIALLDCTRKILSKIMTNRLTNVLINNPNILKEHNYAALPGRSTNEPCFILNNVLEDAKKDNKELWILFQDMSKAYDLVDKERLWKAMRRIRIPDKFINIVKSCLENRTNRVFTEVGTTDPYEMENGVDQGDIISPILWVIYYDPLFAKIKKEKQIGYKMEHSWFPDITSFKTKHIEANIQNLAYMDDTTWLGKNKEDLLEQLKIADSFNRYNGILVNHSKSQLMVLNCPLEKDEKCITYGTNNIIIKPINDDESIRFLGIWVNNKDNKKLVKYQIENIVKAIYRTIINKRITSEQMAYIANMVIIPKIEYRMKCTILNKSECNKAMTRIRHLIRMKAGLVNTIPNAILQWKSIFGMIDLYERQLETQVTNLMVNINDKGILGKITEIQNRKLQEREWFEENPVAIWKYTNVNSFKGCWLAQILCLIRNTGIQFIQTNPDENSTFKITGGKIPIWMIFREEYRKHRDSLRKNRIIYIEQIFFPNSRTLKEWNQLNIEKNMVQKGRTPKWWTLLTERLMDILEHDRYEEIDIKRTILNMDLRNRKSVNQQILPYTKLDFRKTYWLGSIIQSRLVIGRLKKSKINKNINEKYFEIIHYWTRKECSKLILKECKDENCPVGKFTDGACVVSIKKINSIIIIGKVKKTDLNNESRITIAQSFSNIIEEIKQVQDEKISTDKIEETTKIQVQINEIIERELILEQIIEEKSIRKLLKEKFENNIKKTDNNNKEKLIFYTDGSEEKINKKMGFAWIRVENKDAKEILDSFTATTKGWCSSTKAEIFAIFSAIMTVPNNTKVIIYTDSLNAIMQYKKFSNSILPNREKYKLNQHTTWESIIKFTNITRIKLTLKKVKAHTGIWGNEKADMLAKGATLRNDLQTTLKVYTDQSIYSMNWFGIKVENNTRKFVKNINYSIREIEETKLKRINNKENSYKTTWSYNLLNQHEIAEDENRIGLVKSKHKSFKIKLLFNELPTLENLKRRNPGTYKDNWKCPRCNRQNENMKHLWECSKANVDIILLQKAANDFIWEILQNNVSSFKDIGCLHEKLYKYTVIEKTLKMYNNEENTKMYRNLQDTRHQRTYIWDGIGSLDELIQGWINKDLIKIFEIYMKKPNIKKIKEIILKWTNQIILEFKKRIWKKRNNDILEWEKQNNIGKEEKKKTNKNKKLISEQNKIKTTGKRDKRKGSMTSSTFNIDEHFDNFYDKIKYRIGWEKNKKENI